MEEKKVFQEIPGGKHSFHSAILTSYSFNFHHFEYQVLKSLKHKWISNVGILVDSNMLDCSVGLTSAGLRQLTQTYSINGIYCKGAFHPKINFILGDSKILMIVGSGNITPGGHGKNHETFASFYADKENDPLLPLLLEGWEYIKYISKDLEGFSRDRIFNVIPKNCALLTDRQIDKHRFHKIDDETEIALLYNDSTSIISQLVALLPVASIEAITIVCPYFDQEGQLLLQLLNAFPKAEIKIYIPKKFGLPPTAIKPNTRITFYKWEDTERGKKTIRAKEAYERKLHSKIFSFESKDSNYFLIGSANATLAGFGSLEKRGANEEFGVLYKTKQRDFLNELCVSGSTKIDSIADYTRIESLNPDNKKNLTQSQSSKILSCDLSNSSIRLFLKEEPKTEFNIAFYNDIGNEIATVSGYEIKDKTVLFNITFTLLQLNPVYIALKDKADEICSNKQVINCIDKLYDTDPSRENRTIRGLISALEVGKINEFKIMNYLNELNPAQSVSHALTSSTGKGHDERNSLAYLEMTYAEAMETAKNKEASLKLSQMHNTIRIWEVISQLFKENIEKENEELNDEEEDGSAEKSNKRPSVENKKTNHPIQNIAVAERIIHRTDKLAKNYINILNKVNQEKSNLINEVSLVQFLIVSHLITVIHHFTEYDLPFDEKTKKYKSLTPEELKKILSAKYHDLMKQILEVFGKFILLHEFEDVSDNEIRKSKTEDYKQKVLYHALICHYLVHNNKTENPLSQCLDLVCLNLSHKLGLPDKNFNDYVNAVSKTSIKPYNILKLKNRLLMEFNKIQSKEKYFFNELHGVCVILEKTSTTIYFKSLRDFSTKLPLKLKDFNKTNNTDI